MFYLNKVSNLVSKDYFFYINLVEIEGQLSVWVQWTLPAASLSLFTAAGGGTKQRLQFTVEDYQSSFDWNPVYFQSKLRILSASIKHHVMNKSKEWTEGPNQGLILSFGSDITSDLETVSYLNIVCNY